MKYLIEAGPTVDRANDMDARGGPGVALQYIGEKFRPEVFYVSMVRRRVYLVVDLEDFSQVHELIQIIANVTHDEPTVVPVLPVDQAAPMLAKAIENAAKAPKL